MRHLTNASVFFFLRLLLLLSEQGTILDRSWRQLREYDNQASQVLPWLNVAENRLAQSMTQPVKSDPATIKQQISELKVCCLCIFRSLHLFSLQIDF